MMDQDRRPELAPEPKSPPWWTGLLFVFAAPIILAIGFSSGRHSFGPAKAAPDDKIEPATEIPATLFRGWQKPDLAILLSGQTFGYLQPCGCSSPQYGGLVRRYNLVQMLEKKGWRVAGVDLGEIYPNKAHLTDNDGKPKFFLPDQAKEKFKTTLRALELINYMDFGLGAPEMTMPLVNGLAELQGLNIKRPGPLSLDLKDPNKILQRLAVRSYDTIGDKMAKAGVASLVGPSVAQALAGVPDVEFEGNEPMIRALLPVFAKEKVDVAILLVHGTEKEAEAIAKLSFNIRQKNPALPNIDIIVHTSHFDLAPETPQKIQGTNTRLLYMGHKGKDVGVLGLFRKAGGGFELRYQLVSLGPEFETPTHLVDKHPVMRLMQEYSTTVKDSDFMAQYKSLRAPHPTQSHPDLIKANVEAKYVGSDKCGNCHQGAFNVWKNTPHAHAFSTLEKDKNPSLRQFDPECVSCHTVGFKYRTGYYDPPAGANAKQMEKHNENLLNVGCESCHGPGSMHANNPKNKQFLPLINPIKLGNPNGMQKLDSFCQRCHDIENDVHWGQRKPVQKSWAKIAHPGIP